MDAFGWPLSNLKADGAAKLMPKKLLSGKLLSGLLTRALSRVLTEKMPLYAN